MRRWLPRVLVPLAGIAAGIGAVLAFDPASAPRPGAAEGESAHRPANVARGRLRTLNEPAAWPCRVLQRMATG
jgi:hypothetical protein